MRSENSGISLIEILIVLLVTSITLTGSVGTAIISTKLTNNAVQLSDLVFLTNNLDNIFLSQHKLATNDKNGLSLSIVFGDQTALTCSDFNDCTDNSALNLDMYAWHKQLNKLLGSYKGVICHDKTPRDGGLKSSNGCDGLSSSDIVMKLWWLSGREANEEEHFFYRYLSI